MSQIVIHRRERLRAHLALQTAVAVPKPAALDITEIRHFPLREPVSGNRYSLLKITTRSGLIGWGECGFDPNADFKAVQSAWTGKPANTYATIPPLTPFRAALDIAL